MSLVKVHIPNWEKFNPRADRGNFAWFRLQNNFFTDQVIFLLPNEEKLLFVFLCCEASKNNSDNYEIGSEYIAALLKTTEKQITKQLNNLRLSGLVELLNDSSRISDVDALVANVTEQDVTERTGQDVTKRTRRKRSSEPEAVVVHPVIQELKGDTETEKYLEAVPETSQKRWVKLYGAELVKREVLKAIGWLHDSGEEREPGRFLGGWLSRADKSSGGSNARRKTKAEEVSDYNQRMFEAIERGEV